MLARAQGNQPVILDAIPIGATLSVTGVNFGSQPSLTLDGTALDVLTVLNGTTDVVTTILPPLDSGSYLLTLAKGSSNGKGNGAFVSFEVTIGADGATGATGANGATGLTGLIGPAGPSGVLGFYKKDKTVQVAVNDRGTAVASCDAGDKLTGGGYRVMNAAGTTSEDDGDWKVSRAHAGILLRNWAVGMFNGGPSVKSIRAIVICADLTP